MKYKKRSVLLCFLMCMLAGCQTEDAPLEIAIQETSQQSLENGENPELSARIENRRKRAAKAQGDIQKIGRARKSTK